jgi:hypothetical protein
VEIPALDPEASASYLSHRIRAVDGDPAILDSGAIEAIVGLAAGSPRRLNILADNSLYEAYLADRAGATTEDVARAASDLGLTSQAPDGEADEDSSVADKGASELPHAAPTEVGDVIAADTDPPVLDGETAERTADLPDQGPPKEEEIDDLFMDLVEET